MNSRFKFVVVTSSTFLVIFLLIGALHGRSATPEDPYRHLAVYTEVLSRIKSEYVEEPDMKSVTLGAINGLLESIDPYASYLNADQYKQYQKQKDSSKAGIGLVLAKRFGYVQIIDAIPGSPAAKAGLGTTDIVETINGVATRDMPLAFADLLLRGEAGTSVELSVLRFRKPEPQKMTIIRGAIKFPPVTSKMMPDQVGVITIMSLSAGNVKDASAKIQALEKEGAKRLILDLRHSATGTPEEGIQLANLFLDKGLITYTQGQKAGRQNIDAVPAQAITKLPLVVITNRGTADGAEVTAAALLDDKRAEVVGERTYGDAAIRKTINMDDGSAVILSIAKYYSPSGKSIQDNGVTPSVAVAEVDNTPTDPEDETVPEKQPDTPKAGDDPMLKKAIEVVTKGIIASAAHPGAKAESAPGMTPLHIPVPQQ